MALIEFVDGVTKGNAETFNHNFNEVKVESGESENGNWIKYADGTLITVHQVNAALSITKAWGSLYETTEPADLGNFPSAFKHTPFVFLTLYNKDGICGSVKNATNTHAGKVYISAPTTYEQTYTIQVLAIGRWK